MLVLIIVFILSVPFILFALSNTEMVRLGLWPTDYGIEVHLSVAILGAMAIAFLCGGVLVWFSVVSQKARARRAERNVRQLQAQVDDLRSRPSLSLPPAA